MKELVKLALDEITAIKLRLSESEMLKNFLSHIEETNPWTFSEAKLPCILENNESNKYDIESTINDLIDNYPIELANRVYFNTSLKSACSVDNYVRRQIKKHKDEKRIISSLSCYHINIVMQENDSTPTANIYLDSQHFSEAKTGKYKVIGFNKDTHIVTISPVT